MTFELHHDVILTQDAPEYGPRTGDIGAVVEGHSRPGMEDCYGVEFFDLTSRTVAIAISTLRSPTTDDVPTSRLRQTG